MAVSKFSRSRNFGFQNDRGLDPRALATLSAKKNSRAKREDDLRRKQVEREINALRARLNVIDREIERIAVSQRRYHGAENRAENELESESRSLLELTKELGRHNEKIKDLQQALNTKKLLAHKSSISNDFGREVSEKENERLKVELKRVDQEMEQLNGRRRRLVADMASVQQKIQRAYELESKEKNEERQNQDAINDILKELQSEESVLGRFKARFTMEQKNVAEKERLLSETKKRVQGTSSAVPTLQSEKERIERKIRDLENSLK